VRSIRREEEKGREDSPSAVDDDEEGSSLRIKSNAAAIR
jgi:hypothetical protein